MRRTSNFKIETSLKAGVSSCRLASPSQGLEACKNGVMGTWEIAAITGSKSQMGPGYNCEQKAHPAGVGDALCV